MKIIKSLFIIFLLTTFQSCDCMQYVTGTVVDRETKKPITGVKVYKLDKESDNHLTTEMGKFEIRSISGGLFRCPPMKIVVEKDGYESIEHKGGGVIELVKKKQTDLVSNLIGNWKLIKTIKYEKKDSIIQEPSLQLWKTPNAKPFTNISFKDSQQFNISQSCMKCPLLEWSGRYELNKSKNNNLEQFYLNFIDKRERKTSLTTEFNGYVVNINSNELQILNNENCLWIFEKTKNDE